MKRWLPIAAALLAVAVLLGAMQLLNQTPQKPMEMATEAPATPAPMRVLIDKQEVVPERVIIAYNGETTGYVINKQTGTYAAENYDERLTFDQAAMERLFTSCMRLVSRKTIDEASSELSIYGMDEPVCVVDVEFQDGERHEIRVGGRSPLGDGYYGMIDNDPAVYLLLTYDVESFLKGLYDYRSYSLFHDLGDDAENYSLTVHELVIDRNQAGRLCFLRPADGANGETYGIEIHEPVKVNGDEYSFYQKVINPIFSLKSAKLRLMEDNPDDLARYGLDTPQTLLVRDDGGQTRLLIGGEEDGRTYVMRDGIPAVLSVKTRALAFMELDYAQVMDRLVWLYSIDQAQSLTVERQGRTDVLEVRGGTGFWFNGARVDDEKGRALYRSAISLLYDDRAAETAMYKDPECVLTITMLDGTRNRLALYALNERHLEVARDGVTTGFYLNKSGLSDIIRALENLY